MKELNDDNNCFACGKTNPIGLKLDFSYENDCVVSKININRNYQGWKGIVHGGIISTMLDEAMVKAASARNVRCITAEINVKFRSPLKVDEEYILIGKTNDRKRSILFSSAVIQEINGAVIAESTGKLFVVKE